MTTNEQALAVRQWKASEWLFGKRNDNGIQSRSVPLVLHIDKRPATVLVTDATLRYLHQSASVRYVAACTTKRSNHCKCS